jgi:radical SAM protein with 4Fe4S-binding SPASM domain
MAADGYSKRDPGYRSLWKKGHPQLPSLDIELTERCNQNCIHCYINRPPDDPEARSRELTADEWKAILKQAASLGALTVRFTGGEPLLRADFPELYRFARRLGMRVRLFTNATLITKSLAKLFLAIPPLEKIEVTVYGMRKKSVEAVTRIPGSFEQFRKGIDLLLKHHIPFVVKGALLPQNQGEIKAFESWAGSNRKNRAIERLRPKPEKAVAFMARDRELFDRDMRQFCLRFLGPSGKKLLDCGAGHTVSIDAYGMLQPCLLLRHPDLLIDLKHQDLKTALQENRCRIKNITAENPDYLKRCARCFLKNLCEQCPAKSWSEHGTLDTPVEYLCRVAHAQARLLGLLETGENAWTVKNWKERVKKTGISLKVKPYL